MRRKVINFILVLLIIILCCGCSTSDVTTSDTETKSLHETTDTSSKNIGLAFLVKYKVIDELINTQEIIFPDGTTLPAKEGDAKTIVMINGTYYPNIQLKIIDDAVMLPAKIICENLGFNVTWTAESSKLTINNNDVTLTFKVNDTAALVNNEKFTLTAAPQMIDDEIYVPWVFVSDKLDLTTESYINLPLFMYNPVITIDQELNQPCCSGEEGLKYIKDNLNEAYTNFEENFKKVTDWSDEETLLDAESRLKEAIENLKFTREFSRYYIYQGLENTIYLDKYNKDVYFSFPNLGNYEVKKIDFDDTDLFQTYMY